TGRGGCFCSRRLSESKRTDPSDHLIRVRCASAKRRRSGACVWLRRRADGRNEFSVCKAAEEGDTVASLTAGYAV
ncbi:MAG: hypothetical protein K2P27_12750, partial [Lachnospiraceae bacterium]|nr:hypothetical protein [Lachnospiraceae bacterium]